MRRGLRDNGLTLAFLIAMLICIVFQAVAGWRMELSELSEHHQPAVRLVDYVWSSSFGVDLLENWQSEFLQFSLFIVATIWLVQRGSSESKSPDDIGLTATHHTSWVRRHALLLVMTLCFVLTWIGQSVSGWRAFNEEQAWHKEAPVTWTGYVSQPEFWSRSLQNWQSELLAVAAMAVFTVYLREHGSPESKRLDTPHGENEPTY
jgi:hypothetical protein